MKAALFTLCLIHFAVFFVGCTISLSNQSSNGRSSDAVDEKQTASPDVKTDLSVPASLIP